MKTINKIEIDFNDKAMQYDDTGIWIITEIGIDTCCVGGFFRGIKNRIVSAYLILRNGQTLVRLKNYHSLRDKI